MPTSRRVHLALPHQQRAAPLIEIGLARAKALPESVSQLARESR
jgi:hypothetical protein